MLNTQLQTNLHLAKEDGIQTMNEVHNHGRRDELGAPGMSWYKSYRLRSYRLASGK